MKRFALIIAALALAAACQSTPDEQAEATPTDTEQEQTQEVAEAEQTEEVAEAEQTEEVAEAEQTGALDGKTFEVTIREPSGKEETDRLIFADGTFDSPACHEWGFSAVPYQTYTEDGSLHFTAEMTSDEEGTIEWEGVVDGDEISGSYDWMKEGQDTITYSFSGTIAPAETASAPAE